MKYLFVIALLALTACGGGGDDDTAAPPSDENVGHVPPPMQLPCQKDGSCL